MSIRVDKTHTPVEMDNLVNRAGDVGQIELAASQGELKRGSVIDTTGTLLASGATAAYILCDDVDATSAVVADVYKTGNYVANSLIVATGYALTDANREQLRDLGIIVEDAI